MPRGCALPIGGAGADELQIRDGAAFELLAFWTQTRVSPAGILFGAAVEGQLLSVGGDGFRLITPDGEAWGAFEPCRQLGPQPVLDLSGEEIARASRQGRGSESAELPLTVGSFGKIAQQDVVGFTLGARNAHPGPARLQIQRVVQAAAVVRCDRFREPGQRLFGALGLARTSEGESQHERKHAESSRLRRDEGTRGPEHTAEIAETGRAGKPGAGMRRAVDEDVLRFRSSSVSEAAPPRPEPDEFAGIAPRRSRHPVIAAAAVALAAFLVFQVRADLIYALSSTAPQDLGDARALATQAAAGKTLPVNRYVRLAGVPDRESAVILDTQGSWQFSQFFRLLGTQSRLFVRRAPDPLPYERAERDLFVGRLVRLEDLPFAKSIRQHFAEHVSATHFFSPATFHRAMGTKEDPVPLVDRAGEKVLLAPTDELVIDSARPGEIRIELPRQRFADAAKARAAVEAQGATVIEAPPPPLGALAHVIVARFGDDQREQGLSALGDLDRRVRIAPARRSVKAKLANIGAVPDAITVSTGSGEPSHLPIGDVLTVRTVAPVHMATPAFIIMEGDRPRDHIKTLVIVALLIGFALVNLLALRRPT